jgi:hypothetical protein
MTKASLEITTRITPAALDELIDLANGSAFGAQSPLLQAALTELLSRRMTNDAATIEAKNPDGVKVSALAAELGIPRAQFSDIVVETGIGRWIENSMNRRVMLNHWEYAYVASASFYPGLLTAEGADAIRRYVKEGVKPKLQGKAGAPLRKATKAKPPVPPPVRATTLKGE